MSEHIAEIINVKDDQTRSGLVKIRIHGLEENIPEDKLKWVPVMRPGTDPSVNESGNSPIGGTSTGAMKGQKVLVKMIDGQDGQIPMIIGTLPSTERDDDTKKGSTNYAGKGKDSKDYNDNRLIAADGDRTDPKQAKRDRKTLREYAENESRSAYEDDQYKNIEGMLGSSSGSIGQIPSS